MVIPVISVNRRTGAKTVESFKQALIYFTSHCLSFYFPHTRADLSPTSKPTKQIFILMGLFYGLTPVHRQNTKLSTQIWSICAVWPIFPEIPHVNEMI